MAQVQEAFGAAVNTRRVPTAHSEAVQEAKRLEKMQTHSSSHRSAAPASKPAVGAQDATS